MPRVLAVLVGLVGSSCVAPGGGAETPLPEYFLLVGGERVPTAAPVIPWFAPDGYNAYRTEPFLAEEGEIGLRYHPGRDHPAFEGEGSFRDRTRRAVDLFVLHYDVCGTSRRCFRVLHDLRGLSVHFLLDVDGTIYQTLDLQEQAWHARQANPRSIGIEIAQIGSYEPGDRTVLERWYTTDAEGARLTFPPGVEDPGKGERVFRPARPEAVRGRIHGAEYEQYDFTPEQYESLVALTRTLVAEFPALLPDVPRDASGEVRTDVLDDEEFRAFSGILGHSHVSSNKRDPGPAFDWERFLSRVRQSP